MVNFSPLIDSPMFIVTCEAEGERAGCLVGFGTQCSIEPARFLICLSVVNHTFVVANRAKTLAVHVLAKDERAIASRFGEISGDDVDKFAGLAWHSGQLGAPILSDCSVVFEGTIIEKIPFGDHVGFLLAPTDALDVRSELGDDEQLELRDVADFSAGKPIEETEQVARAV